MVALAIGEQISSEEQYIANILISIICLYGDDGLPLEIVDREFENYCGFPIPWKQFGANSLKSWLITLPRIYVVYDYFNREVLIEQSPKSLHIKNLIKNQKRHQPQPNMGYNDDQWHVNDHQTITSTNFLHLSIENVQQDANRYKNYAQLESMLPLFYRHQALGDDFFVDIADTKMGYYIPENGPKQIGLCVAGQTIAGLTERVKSADHIAPRVVVMIGYQDLINDQSINSMVTDLRQLVVELKKRQTRITLVTLAPSPKLPNVPRFHWRMDIFNRAILDYSNDPILACNVIDMEAIFKREISRRGSEKFTRVARNDKYKVFSDYGKKIFLTALKACLREQLGYEI
ncbi:unnamed protein product [Ceutorhynchus assimilis]|uniref:OSK domain-containing protein n=1 Tax=Ceutorhynchus assimilis TaxID=467358 RepID=A0A9N9MKJ9_9CUCU|nr:unnamed protein product [Ceutorhynchus assimilis]